MPSNSDARDLIEHIPDPESVRARLADLFAEAAMLRALLRLAERKSQYRPPLLAEKREGKPCRT